MLYSLSWILGNQYHPCSMCLFLVLSFRKSMSSLLVFKGNVPCSIVVRWKLKGTSTLSFLIVVFVPKTKKTIPGTPWSLIYSNSFHIILVLVLSSISFKSFNGYMILVVLLWRWKHTIIIHFGQENVFFWGYILYFLGVDFLSFHLVF
jgi:hypothetical protein